MCWNWPSLLQFIPLSRPVPKVDKSHRILNLDWSNICCLKFSLDLTSSATDAFLRLLFPAGRSPRLPLFSGRGGTTLCRQNSHRTNSNRISHLATEWIFISCPQLCSSSVCSLRGCSPYVRHRSSFRRSCLLVGSYILLLLDPIWSRSPSLLWPG